MLSDQAILLFTEFLISADRSQKTIIGYQSDLRNFARFYEHKYNGPWYVEETTSQDIEDFFAYIKQGRNLNPATRNRILYGIKSFFRFLERRKICTTDITRNLQPVPYNKPERMHLQEEEMESFIDHIRHPLVQIVAVTLAYTGMRISECVHLRIQDVDFAKRTLSIIAGKGNKDRTIPIADKLYPKLLQYYQEHRDKAAPNQWFFATETTGQLSDSHVNHVFRRTSEAMGLKKHITAHIFRHSFATNLVQKGVNLVQVQKLLGHSSLTVTSVYTHATIENLSDAVNQL
ncbi:tyrosine-type recombinase/integrase [Alicyclobacillus tolerans]|uniref:tyrosine-type recombinase/integrase n=1 Tax=Alicyclobacillus tolerans TaxID=90970 RepID=UPI001F005915|nr:tyrosine-type recombinase/integrase [Alicyclobacillus tolerans]MCF8568389.1 tyrosine-type recombinase/integrase [Alicyclobacillus tolerans]